MDGGTVLHTLMLEQGRGAAVFEVTDFRTAEVRRARDTALVAGRMLLKESDSERMSMLCRSMFDYAYFESAATSWI